MLNEKCSVPISSYDADGKLCAVHCQRINTAYFADGGLYSPVSDIRYQIPEMILV